MRGKWTDTKEDALFKNYDPSKQKGLMNQLQEK